MNHFRMQLSIDLLIIVLSNYSEDEAESLQGKRKIISGCRQLPSNIISDKNKFQLKQFIFMRIRLPY